MHRRTTPTPVLAALAGLTGARSGCGGGTADVARPDPTATYTAGDVRVLQPGAPGESADVVEPGETGELANPGAYNDADVEFVTNMVPHHTQALAMASLAPERAQDPRVADLAERIALAQGPEIDLMQSWLAAQGLPPADPEAAHDAHESMRGMATPEQMFELESATGEEFDRLFLTMMTEHHEGALEMADASGAAQHPIVADMVADTVVSQGTEINRMQALLAEL